MKPFTGIAVLLFVDDSSAIRQVIAQGIGEDVIVHLADSGEQALEILSTRKIDAILCDFEMPGMNGIEVLSQVRALHHGVLRFLTSGCLPPDLQDHLDSQLLDGFLEKPLLAHRVLKDINRIVAEKTATS